MGKTSPAGERTNNSDSFTVQDGLLHIQASGKTSAHLFYVGDLKEGFEKFNNFELEAIRVFHGGDNGAYRYSLFNLRDDLSEKHNLAAAQPERVKELDALIEHFLIDTKSVVPIPNPAFNPAKYHIEDEGQQKPKAKPQPKAAAKRAK